MIYPPPRSTLFPYTTLFRSDAGERCLHKIHSTEDCLLAEAVSGSQPAPEIELIPVGHVDAHFLYQSRRPRTFQFAQAKAREGQGRTASTLPQGLKFPIDLTAPLSMTNAPDRPARGGTHAGCAHECRRNCKAPARSFSAGLLPRLRTGDRARRLRERARTAALSGELYPARGDHFRRDHDGAC